MQKIILSENYKIEIDSRGRSTFLASKKGIPYFYRHNIDMDKSIKIKEEVPEKYWSMKAKIKQMFLDDVNLRLSSRNIADIFECTTANAKLRLKELVKEGFLDKERRKQVFKLKDIYKFEEYIRTNKVPDEIIKLKNYFLVYPKEKLTIEDIEKIFKCNYLKIREDIIELIANKAIEKEHHAFLYYRRNNDEF